MVRAYGLGIMIFAGLCSVAWPGDRNPAFVTEWPSVHSADLVPEIQTEGFTCGLHALNSIYRSYGLTAEKYRLRDRLGVDVPTIPIGTDTKGTVQPDVFRVLSQDGFAAETLRLKTPKEKDLLAEHLREKHPVMTLIKRKENGHLHWVVITDLVDNKLTIADSLFSNGLYQEPYEPFASENILNAILIRPNQKYSKKRTLWGNHGLGLLALVRSATSDAGGLIFIFSMVTLHAFTIYITGRSYATQLTYLKCVQVLVYAIVFWLVVAVLVDGSFGYAPLLITALAPIIYIGVFHKFLKMPIRSSVIVYLLSLLIFVPLFLLMGIIVAPIITHPGGGV